MSGKYWSKRLEWLAVVGLVLAAGLAERGLAEDVGGGGADVQVEELPGVPADILLDDVPRVPTEQWIGVVCTPVVEPLRVHLGLPAGEGLLVIHVAAGSPAAKAKLENNDILLKAGDKPLGDAEALVTAVKESGGKPIDLELIREGKKMSLTVEPDQRPEKLETPLLPDAKSYVEWFRPWLDRPELIERIPLRLRQIAPGLLRIGRKLPEGVSVTVTKEGKQPAKITVKEGDETWETTENELDKLPEKARSYVSDILGRPGPLGRDLQIFFDVDAAERERVRKPKPEQGRLEQRLERLEKRLEELAKGLRQREDPDKAATTDE